MYNLNAIVIHTAFVIAPASFLKHQLGAGHYKCCVTYLIIFTTLKLKIILSSCEVWKAKAIEISSNLLKVTRLKKWNKQCEVELRSFWILCSF